MDKTNRVIKNGTKGKWQRSVDRGALKNIQWMSTISKFGKAVGQEKGVAARLTALGMRYICR